MKYLFVTLFLVISTLSYAQEQTTFILVRHAEKASDGTADPPLTQAGEARAANILSLLQYSVITAIYSTNYKRTQMTVAPLAEAKDLDIISYDPRSLKEFVAMLLEDKSGGTIIISGHSNTTPMLANLLLGEEKLKQFEDSDYGNLLIITVDSHNNAKLLHLRF